MISDFYYAMSQKQNATLLAAITPAFLTIFCQYTITKA
jgi:hypothetical protein